MRLKELIINNLYRYGIGVQHIFNEEDDKTLISGINNDEPGCDSNGSGKSSIPNIVFWTIFGNSFTENFQKENTDEIVRRGEENGSAKLTLSNGKNTMVIYRGKGKKASHNFLELKYNDNNINVTTPTKTQEELLRLLNISPALKPKDIITDFLNTTYFSTATVKGFIAKETKSKERFEIIERFLSLKTYSMASDLAKERKKETLNKIEGTLEEIANKENELSKHNEEEYKRSIESINEEIKKSELQIESIQKDINSEKERNDLSIKIQNLESQIKSKKSATESHYKTLKSTYDQNSASINQLKIDLQKYNDLNKKILEINPKFEQAKKSVNDLTKRKEEVNNKIIDTAKKESQSSIEIKNIKSQVANHLKCPTCNSSLMIHNNVLENIDIDMLTNLLVEKEKVIQDIYN